MVDLHVHLRDWAQSSKETVKHGLHVASMCGIRMVADMPNTSPALTSRDVVLMRLALASGPSRKYGVRYCIHMGLTADEAQIAHAVETYRELFPLVIGHRTQDVRRAFDRRHGHRHAGRPEPHVPDPVAPFIRWCAFHPLREGESDASRAARSRPLRDPVSRQTCPGRDRVDKGHDFACPRQRLSWPHPHMPHIHSPGDSPREEGQRGGHVDLLRRHCG